MCSKCKTPKNSQLQDLIVQRLTKKVDYVVILNIIIEVKMATVIIGVILVVGLIAYSYGLFNFGDLNVIRKIKKIKYKDK